MYIFSLGRAVREILPPFRAAPWFDVCVPIASCPATGVVFFNTICSCLRQFFVGIVQATGGGVAGPGSFTPTPPPSLEIGTDVPDHQRQRRPKANLLEPLEDQKMGFHPMCLYSKYSVFSGEPNDG